jgi:polysaccharide biosynthesis transport protein
LQAALERPHEQQPGDELLTLTDLLHIVVKHKWTLLVVILLASTVAAVRTFLSTPIYLSTVTLHIERAAPIVVKFNNESDQDPYVDEAMTQKTQYELLKSRSLAERVIDELKLDQSKPSAAAHGADAAPGSDIGANESGADVKWAAAGFIDTLLRWKMKLEVVHGNEKAIQPGVQA